ncbi:exonuclease V [Xylariaceae sp. FL0804]|nr:exonuclease V [Xylariaceae sp. FL0804]
MAARTAADDSDYGSDFSAGEETIVNQLLEDLGSNTTRSPSRRHVARTAARIQHRARYAPGSEAERGPESPSQSVPLGIQYPDLSRALAGIEPSTSAAAAAAAAAGRSPGPPPADDKNNSRSRDGPPPPDDDAPSPLERFRSFPRKPFSVTDLSAGAWCELQYEYTLTRLPGGKRTRTAVMRGGSRVHRTLEDQVHTAVHVDVATKEEAFALRLWNIIQGLRTLRETGMTRELEVWGVIEGQVVNGVIDHLSYQSPNAKFEEELNLTNTAHDTPEPSAGRQSSITDYIKSTSHKKVYLLDVKTRGSDRLPTGAALRPTRVQLFLYHRLLSDMASGGVDYSAILNRYGLRADAHFSDAFIAQMGGLHDEVFYDADSDVEKASTRLPGDEEANNAPPASSQRSCSSMPSSPDMVRYRSMGEIIPLLESELREAFPRGAASLGELLAVQYRHRADGRVIGNNAFPNDPEALMKYLKNYLDWWRGERGAAGVAIEETYKCHYCEFVEGCQWRIENEAKLIGGLELARARERGKSSRPGAATAR